MKFSKTIRAITKALVALGEELSDTPEEKSLFQKEKVEIAEELNKLEHQSKNLRSGNELYRKALKDLEEGRIGFEELDRIKASL